MPREILVLGCTLCTVLKMSELLGQGRASEKPAVMSDWGHCWTLSPGHSTARGEQRELCLVSEGSGVLWLWVQLHGMFGSGSAQGLRGAWEAQTQ